MIGNVKNRSTKLGQEYADVDHKLCTTPLSTEWMKILVMCLSSDVSTDAKMAKDN